MLNWHFKPERISRPADIPKDPVLIIPLRNLAFTFQAQPS